MYKAMIFQIAVNFRRNEARTHICRLELVVGTDMYTIQSRKSHVGRLKGLNIMGE